MADRKQEQKRSGNVLNLKLLFIAQTCLCRLENGPDAPAESGVSKPEVVNGRHSSSNPQSETSRARATYKVEEAAAHFVAGVRLGLQELLHHGQEVSVDGEDLLNVGEQNLEGRAGTLGLAGRDADCTRWNC